MSEAEPVDRRDEYRDTILFPMVRDKRFRELCDRILEMLDTESDPDFRFALIADLTTFLRFADADEESLQWSHKLTEEFADDPMAWTNLAAWYFYSPHPGHPNGKHMADALLHYRAALQVARKQNLFVRYVLFDICRVLTAMAEYGLLTDYMSEILADMEVQREVDIPQFEADWLKRVPMDAIDPGLRETFIRLVEADEKRRQSGASEMMSPTMSDLEPCMGDQE